MAQFAIDELGSLVDQLSTQKPVLEVTDGDLMGALILAAQRSPAEAVKAFVASYWDTELEIAAAHAVCAFIRAHAE